MSFGSPACPASFFGLHDERGERLILGRGGWLDVVVHQRIGGAIEHAGFDVVLRDTLFEPRSRA